MLRNKIDPTKLTEHDAEQLASLLMRHEQSRIDHSLIKTTEAGADLQLTHHLLRAEKFNPRTKQNECRYYVVERDNEIGQGSFGSVHKVTGVITIDQKSKKAVYKKHQSDKQRIVKKCSYKNKRTETIALLEKEVSALSKTGYHHVKPIVLDSDSAYIVSAQFKSCDLFDFITDLENKRKSISIEQRLILSRNLIRALHEQVHKKGLTHHDIKPENIMVNEASLKVTLIDFGLAYPTCSQPMTGGTPDYAAPEVIYQSSVSNSRKPPFDCRIGADFNSNKSDIYSLGMVLARLWGSRQFICLGNHTNLVEAFDALLQKHKDNAASKQPTFSDLFAGITDITSLADPEQQIIRDTIRSMCSHQYQERTELVTAYESFSSALLSHKYGLDAELLDQVETAANIGRFGRKALEEASHVDSLHLIINKKIIEVTDKPECIQEFVTRLGVEAFNGCKTRQAVRDKTQQILQSFYLQNTALLNLSACVESSLIILGTTAQTLPSMREKISAALQELDYAWYKHTQYRAQRMTLDSIEKLSKSLEQSAKKIETIFTELKNEDPQKNKRIKQLQSHYKIMGDLFAARNDQGDARRLAQHLHHQIKKYLEETFTRDNIKKYDRAGSAVRQQDMLELLEIIKTRRTSTEIEQAVQEKLASFKRVGLFGSKLKKNIERALTEFHTEQNQRLTAIN